MADPLGDDQTENEATEPTQNDIGAFIREQRQLAELSLRKLADRAGVSNPYLSQIERGLRRPSAEILQQLAKALEMSAETMYIQAGILDRERKPENSSLEAAIRRSQELTEEQRKALLGVYRSFVAANTGRDGGEGAEPGDDSGSDSGSARAGIGDPSAETGDPSAEAGDPAADAASG